MKTMTAISATQRMRRPGAFLPIESFLPTESAALGTRAPASGSRLAGGPAVRDHIVPNPTKAFAGASGYALVTDPHGSVSGRPPG